jgi:hypothetical protein
MQLTYRPMPPRLTLLLAAAILLALLVLNSCSPAVKVARHYKRFTHGLRKELRKPMHNLPLR